MPTTQLASTKLARLNSLDIARGVLLVITVWVNSLVVYPSWLAHHPWAGFTFIDWIFPAFVTLTGCAMAFAYRNGLKDGRRLARRVLVLFGAGILYNIVIGWSFDLSTLRVFGVLQLYAVVILIVSVAHIWLRTWRVWLMASATLIWLSTLLFTWSILACNGLTQECNPSRLIDLQPWFIDHVYRQGAQGHDPEGLVAIAGATIQASIGATFGHVIMSTRGLDRKWPAMAKAAISISTTLVALGVMALLLPSFLGQDPMPIMKRLWTPPFAIMVGVSVGLALLLANLTIDAGTDRERSRRARQMEPLIALGRNSLLVYFGVHVVSSLSRRFGLFDYVVGLFPSTQAASWGVPILALLAWTALALILNRKKIYIRA